MPLSAIVGVDSSVNEVPPVNLCKEYSSFFRKFHPIFQDGGASNLAVFLLRRPISDQISNGAIFMPLYEVLNDEALTLADEDFFENGGLSFAFSNVIKEWTKISFRLVVRPSYAPQAKVAGALFKARRPPEGVELTRFHRGDRDLWVLNWSTDEIRCISGLMNRRFANYLDEYYSPGLHHNIAEERFFDSMISCN